MDGISSQILGTKEIDGVESALISDERLALSAAKFKTDMVEILQLWYSCMRFLQRTGRLSPSDIATFRSKRQQLKLCIRNLVDYNEPLSLPTQRKWHIFFGDDLDRQIRNWEVIGSVAEQNTGK